MIGKSAIGAAVLACASLGAVAIAAPAMDTRAIVNSGIAPTVSPVRHRQSHRGPVAGYARRSRGPQAKPARHKNLARVGRRTRRKHRRAA